MGTELQKVFPWNLTGFKDLLTQKQWNREQQLLEKLSLKTLKLYFTTKQLQMVPSTEFKSFMVPQPIQQM